MEKLYSLEKIEYQSNPDRYFIRYNQNGIDYIMMLQIPEDEVEEITYVVKVKQNRSDMHKLSKSEILYEGDFDDFCLQNKGYDWSTGFYAPQVALMNFYNFFINKMSW